MHGWTFIISWEFTDRAVTYCILALETLVMWVLHLMKLSRENWYQIIVQPQCGLNRQTTAIIFSFSFSFVSMCRNFLRDKQFRWGPDAATHLYTALHTQVMFEYEWSQNRVSGSWDEDDCVLAGSSQNGSKSSWALALLARGDAQLESERLMLSSCTEMKWKPPFDLEVCEMKWKV